MVELAALDAWCAGLRALFYLLLGSLALAFIASHLRQILKQESGFSAQERMQVAEHLVHAAIVATYTLPIAARWLP